MDRSWLSEGGSPRTFLVAAETILGRRGNPEHKPSLAYRLRVDRGRRLILQPAGECLLWNFDELSGFVPRLQPHLAGGLAS